jgi:hypothetical protein
MKRMTKIQKDVLDVLWNGGYLIETIDHRDKRRDIFLYLDPGGTWLRENRVHVKTFDFLCKQGLIYFAHKDETCLAVYLRWEITTKGKSLFMEA